MGFVVAAMPAAFLRLGVIEEVFVRFIRSHDIRIMILAAKRGVH